METKEHRRKAHSMEIKKALNDSAIELCFDALKELRPNINKSNHVALITGMISRGYQLIYVEHENTAVAVAGFRYSEHLLWGKIIYIDDLSTIPAYRGMGFASLLIDYIVTLAQKESFNAVHLDSGVNSGRFNAHRLYLNKGFNISSLHFALNLKSNN